MRKELVILMAEDNRGHFVLTQNYFARMGVRNELVWFADGQETIDYLFTSDGHAKLHPGKEFILFLDIRMPKVDGWEVLKRIKASPKLKDMPVVMLTALENPEDIQRSRDLGCAAYIIKPVKYSSYINTMRKIGVFPSMVAQGVELITKCTA